MSIGQLRSVKSGFFIARIRLQFLENPEELRTLWCWVYDLSAACLHGGVAFEVHDKVLTVCKKQVERMRGSRISSKTHVVRQSTYHLSDFPEGHLDWQKRCNNCTILCLSALGNSQFAMIGLVHPID